MLTEIYIEALLVDEELADQVWELVGVLCSRHRLVGSRCVCRAGDTHDSVLPDIQLAKERRRLTRVAARHIHTGICQLLYPSKWCALPAVHLGAVGGRASPKRLRSSLLARRLHIFSYVVFGEPGHFRGFSSNSVGPMVVNSLGPSASREEQSRRSGERSRHLEFASQNPE